MNIWTTEVEAENLAARFINVNRAEFVRKNKIKGGQAIVYQHITGRRPISLYAALAYAAGFGVGLENISPRLARESTNAAAATGSKLTVAMSQQEAANDFDVIELSIEVLSGLRRLSPVARQLILDAVRDAVRVADARIGDAGGKR